MTCIVGFCKNGEMYMGSDSLGSNSYGECSPYDNPKIFYKKPGFLYGCTSSYRMIQLLEHCLSEPEHVNGSDLHYMSRNYSFAILELFEKAKFAETKSNVSVGGQYLLGYKGNLYKVQSDFSVLKCSDPYHAVGSGGELAISAMYSQIEAYKRLKKDFDPFEIIHTSLMAAEKHNSYVRRPFHIIKVDKESKLTVKKFGKG